MGENTNWKSNENDWRSQLKPDLRERVISTIVAKLLILFPKNRQDALTQMATTFEEKMYGIAKDKDDYLRIIVNKMHLIEKKCVMMQSSSSVNGANTHDSGGQVVLNPGQSVPTSLQSTQTSTSQQCLLQQNLQRNLNSHGSSVLQTQVPINVSMAPDVNTQPQNSNYMVQHQVNQQLLKEKIRHGNLRPPHMQQQTQPQPQQHLQSFLKQCSHQSFPQSSGFSVLPSSGQQNSLQQNSQLLQRHEYPTQRVYSSMVLPSQDKMDVPSLQQNHLTSRQSIGEQQGAFMHSYQVMAPQNDLKTMHQQHFNNAEAFSSKQQQTLPGTQSGDYNGSSLLGQEVGQSQTYQPQFPVQQQQHLGSINNETQRFQASNSLHKTKNITDLLNFPQQLLRTPLPNPSTSQDSTGKTINGSGGDWQEETYQKIKALKVKHSLLLSTMRQRLAEKLREAAPQKMQSEMTEKLRKMKFSVEKVLMFLNVHRRNISEEHRDRFSLYEENILKLTKSHTAVRRPMQQQQGHVPPQTHQTALQSQVPQVNVSQSLLKDEMNSLLTPSNQNRALTPVSGVMTSQTSVPHSFEIKPKLEPRDENNTLASSRNVVLPSIKQKPSSNLQVEHSNINPVQSSMLQQKQRQFQYRHMQQSLLQRKQQQQKQSQQPQQANQQLQRPTSQQSVNNTQCQLLKAVASPDMLSNISPSAPSASSQSSGSPFVVSPPATSFAPSTIPRDPEKPMSLESPVSHSQSPAKPSTQEQPPVSLPPEPIAERAIDRLIKACQSSSPKSLAESFSEISSVVSMVDRFAGSCQHVGGSRGGLGENLSKTKMFHLMTDGETISNKRMKRLINALPQESEVNSTASSGSKVNKTQSSCVLMQEIKEINSTLLETVVEICDEDVYRSKVTSGTIVMCSYDPVALTDTFKAHYYSGQISQIEPLRLLVPANYPNSSPILLEGISFDASSHNYEDLSAQTRSKFSLSLRVLTEPMSLKKMAQTWTDCARATMIEYATRHGGGTFSSKYGSWDTVLRAS